MVIGRGFNSCLGRVLALKKRASKCGKISKSHKDFKLMMMVQANSLRYAKSKDSVRTVLLLEC